MLAGPGAWNDSAGDSSCRSRESVLRLDRTHRSLGIARACRQVQAWRAAGLHAVPVAVNVSALEFRHSNFAEGVALILKETGLPPSYLELELTESIIMHDTQLLVSALEALKTMGVKLAIDDFGTGYSSLVI